MKVAHFQTHEWRFALFSFLPLAVERGTTRYCGSGLVEFFLLDELFPLFLGLFLATCFSDSFAEHHILVAIQKQI